MNWLVICVCAWFIGIALGDTTAYSWGFLIGCVCCLAGIRWRSMWVVGIALWLGVWRMQTHMHIAPLPSTPPTHVVVTVADIKQTWQSKQALGYDAQHHGYLIDVPQWQQIWRGDQLAVHGDFKSLPPAQTAWSEQKRRQHIVGSFTKTTITRLQPAQPLLVAIDSARMACYAIIMRHFSEPHASIVTGMLLGISGDIHPDVASAFRRSGTTHILVISGWNITIVAAISHSLALRIGGHRIVQLLIPLAIISIYVAFTGASAAVIRAGVMGCMMVIGRWLGRPRHMPTIIAGALALITAVHPYSLWDIGMQLSTAATIGLVAFATPIEHALKRYLLADDAMGWIRESLASTIAAQIPTLPIMLCRLGVPSPWSLLANVLVTPVVPYAMLLGTIFIVIALLIPPLATACAWLAAPLFGWIIAGSLAIARLPGAGMPAIDMTWIEWVLHGVWLSGWWYRARYHPADSVV